MAQAEQPERLRREVTVDDVRQLMGSSTPHFALQLRNRIARLIGDSKAISVLDQSRIDALLEIVPVNAPATKLPSS